MISINVDYLEDKLTDWKNRKIDAENAKILQQTNEAMTWMKQTNSDVANHGSTLKM